MTWVQFIINAIAVILAIPFLLICGLWMLVWDVVRFAKKEKR